MSDVCPRCGKPYPENRSRTAHKRACFDDDLTPAQREERRAYLRADKQRRNAERDQRKKLAERQVRLHAELAAIRKALRAGAAPKDGP